MKRAVLKYSLGRPGWREEKRKLETGDVLSLELPECAEVLTFGEQAGVLTLWARVLIDPAPPTAERRFLLCGTGQPGPDELTGSFIVGAYGLEVFFSSKVNIFLVCYPRSLWS